MTDRPRRTAPATSCQSGLPQQTAVSRTPALDGGRQMGRKSFFGARKQLAPSGRRWPLSNQCLLFYAEHAPAPTRLPRAESGGNRSAVAWGPEVATRPIRLTARRGRQLPVVWLPPSRAVSAFTEIPFEIRPRGLLSCVHVRVWARADCRVRPVPLFCGASLRLTDGKWSVVRGRWSVARGRDEERPLLVRGSMWKNRKLLTNGGTLAAGGPGAGTHRDRSSHLPLNCSTAQLLNCSTAQLLNCSTAQLLNCSTAHLLTCSTAQLLSCSTTNTCEHDWKVSSATPIGNLAFRPCPVACRNR